MDFQISRIKVADKNFPAVGQLQRVGATIEDAESEGSLQRLDASAERRLRDVAGFGRQGKAARLLKGNHVIALEESRSFTLAAKARNISQSSFSRRIQSLEASLGFSIFDRSANPLQLTNRGKIFVGYFNTADLKIHVIEHISRIADKNFPAVGQLQRVGATIEDAESELTNRGKIFVGYARNMLDDMDFQISRIKGLNNTTQKIRIDAAPSLSVLLLPEIIAGYTDRKNKTFHVESINVNDVAGGDQVQVRIKNFMINKRIVH